MTRLGQIIMLSFLSFTGGFDQNTMSEMIIKI